MLITVRGSPSHHFKPHIGVEHNNHQTTNKNTTHKFRSKKFFLIMMTNAGYFRNCRRLADIFQPCSRFIFRARQCTEMLARTIEMREKKFKQRKKTKKGGGGRKGERGLDERVEHFVHMGKGEVSELDPSGSQGRGEIMPLLDGE